MLQRLTNPFWSSMTIKPTQRASPTSIMLVTMVLSFFPCYHIHSTSFSLWTEAFSSPWGLTDQVLGLFYLLINTLDCSKRDSWNRRHSWTFLSKASRGSLSAVERVHCSRDQWKIIPEYILQHLRHLVTSHTSEVITLKWRRTPGAWVTVFGWVWRHMKNLDSDQCFVKSWRKRWFSREYLSEWDLFFCYETSMYFCFNIHCVTQIHVNVKCLYS